MNPTERQAQIDQHIKLFKYPQNASQSQQQLIQIQINLEFELRQYVNHFDHSIGADNDENIDP